MSVLEETENVVIISHELLLNKMYEKVNCDGELLRFVVRKEFFDIMQPFKVITKRKHQNSGRCVRGDINVVQKKLEEIRTKLLTALLNGSSTQSECLSPKEAADKFYVEARLRKTGDLIGGNLSPTCLVATINSEQSSALPSSASYLIPGNSQFYNYDVKEISKHVQGRFDVILLDPPWWNKYIRRKRAASADAGYSMMWDKELAEIPIDSLLENDGMVAVWCTNATSHIDALIKDIFPRWGVKFISQWFWLKVTKKGEVVTPFSPANGKQPFEKLIFGARDLSRAFPQPESEKVIVSVPSAIHSHKPPLCELLQPFLPPNPRGLEIFARSLLPNWTSYGNEVLKLQHISLFTNAQDDS